MVKLSFAIQTNLVIGGRVCYPAKFVAASQERGLSCQDEPPSAITGFYISAFASGDSDAFCLRRVCDGPEGTLLELDWPDGAPDTVKFSLDFGQATPKTVRSDHCASGFVQVAALREILDQSRGLGSFSNNQRALILTDNFTRNTALLRFLDRGSDLRGLSRLSLRPSSLLRLDETNRAIDRLNEKITNMLCSDCVVSPANAGTQFTNGITSSHMENHRLHYATLGDAFDNIRTSVSLPLLLYNAYQTMHSTNLTFAALSAMPVSELVPRFGLPLVSRHTACALTNVYCPDVTVAVTGAVCKLQQTEDIARSLSRINYEIQNQSALKAYQGRLDASCALQDALQAIRDDQGALAADPDGLGGRRRTPTLDADDCENKAQFIMQVTAALKLLSAKYQSTGGLSEAVAQVARENPKLFAQCTPEHVRRMSAILWRMSTMLGNGQWTMGLAVVSAKGPSFKEDSPQAGEGLCGHGACVARVLSGADSNGQKLYQHYPVEGTTYLTVDYPVPKTHAAELSVKMVDGSSQTFPVETLLGVIAQNVHGIAGTSANANALAHLRRDYGKKALGSPFYVSVFYTNLGKRDKTCLGSIPMVDEGSKPGFGAPFMGLSNDNVKSFLLTTDMLAAQGENPEQLVELMHEQITEAWEPGVSEATLKNYLTYLQPVKNPGAPTLGVRDYATSARVENTWAFDSPELTAKAVVVYQKIADKFNELQAKEQGSDGARAQAYGQYLSACLGISLPLPKTGDAKNFKLTTIKNLSRAVKELELVATIKSCALKTAILNARASVATDHHIYMCDRGEGIVHSYRNKLSTN